MQKLQIEIIRVPQLEVGDGTERGSMGSYAHDFTVALVWRYRSICSLRQMVDGEIPRISAALTRLPLHAAKTSLM